MKTFISLLVLLLFIAMSLSAQTPVQDTIPQLKTWWSAPDEKSLGASASYLPNFYHGKDAMAVQTKNGMETWLNRFPGDRENVFSWQGNAPIYRVDINGDSIIDYIDKRGNIYKGIQNGEPPEIKPTQTLKYFFGNENWHILIADFNSDGIPDVLRILNSRLTSIPDVVSIYYGNKDIAQIKQVQLSSTLLESGNYWERIPVCIYRTDKNSFRLIISKRPTTNSPYHEDGFELYAIELTNGENQPNLRKLSEYLVNIPTNSDGNFSIGLGSFYQSRYHNKKYFFALSKNNSNFTIFDVSNDNYEMKQELNVSGGYRIIPLEYSINSNKYEDFVVFQAVEQSKVLNFYDGGEILSLKPFACYKLPCTNSANSIFSCQDFNNDGILDLACTTYEEAAPPFCFQMIESPKLLNAVEPNESNNIFTLSGTIPHPLSTNSSVSITISKEGTYSLSLYSSDGKEVKNIFHGILQMGEQTLPLDVSGLSNGTYILQLQSADNSVISHRSIIITK